MAHGCITQYTYLFCYTETAVSLSPLLGLCRSSIVTVTTSVILVLVMLLIMLLTSVHVYKFFCLTSCQHGSLSLKAGSVQRLANCTVANLKLAWSKFYCTYMFEWCFQRAVLRQTYHMANMMPESPVFAISQAHFWLQTFLELFLYLLLVSSSHYSETFMWLLVELLDSLSLPVTLFSLEADCTDL